MAGWLDRYIGSSSGGTSPAGQILLPSIAKLTHAPGASGQLGAFGQCRTHDSPRLVRSRSWAWQCGVWTWGQQAERLPVVLDRVESGAVIQCMVGGDRWTMKTSRDGLRCVLGNGTYWKAIAIQSPLPRTSSNIATWSRSPRGSFHILGRRPDGTREITAPQPYIRCSRRSVEDVGRLQITEPSGRHGDHLTRSTMAWRYHRLQNRHTGYISTGWHFSSLSLNCLVCTQCILLPQSFTP